MDSVNFSELADDFVGCLLVLTAESAAVILVVEWDAAFTVGLVEGCPVVVLPPVTLDDGKVTVFFEEGEVWDAGSLAVTVGSLVGPGVVVITGGVFCIGVGGLVGVKNCVLLASRNGIIKPKKCTYTIWLEI